MSQPTTSLAKGLARKPRDSLQPNTSHPRRPPAHQSVSLRHTPPVARKDAPTSTSSQMAVKSPKESSDDNGPILKLKNSSSEESSNADHWFEKSNNNVRHNTPTVNDNTPPFYFQNSSNDSPEEGDPSGANATSLPIRLGPIKERSLASSSEEYRSVIDDLTIQNKKLKKRLKKFQKLDVPQLQSDKLFEIRFHGLPLHKRRELEDTLRRFASALGSSSEEASGSSTAAQAHQSVSAVKPGSSQFADSGYGSMATSSGVGSRTRSGQGDATRQSQFEAVEARDKSIRSYLHDMPAGLLPRPAAVMSEKSKKKLVVRRLEQVFVGRGATTDGHQQPIQQQEVSRLAAESEAKGKKVAAEGPREARIMVTETEEPMDLTEDQEPAEGASSVSPPSRRVPVKVEEHTKESEVCEQRPTRPLDLDLHRAQVAAENIDYIRHLGFSLSDLGGRSPIDQEGWIYLNLLANMAQVHTLNVTLDFVRQAVADYSHKLFLSKDGRKIRWKGGPDMTANSGNSSSGAEGTTPGSGDVVDAQRVGDKRPRPAHVEESSSPYENGVLSKKQDSSPEKYDQSFIYKPIFLRQRTSDSDSESSSLSEDEDDDDASFESSPIVGDPTGATSSYFPSTVRQTTAHGKHRDDGPLIFYNNAKFCTDLSGDSGRHLRQPVTSDYHSFTTVPIGETPVFHKMNRVPSKFSERPFYRVSQPPSSDDTDSSEASFELHFPNASPKHVTFAEPPQPIEFTVSGVGGVRPDDNVAIHVLRKRTVNNKSVVQPKVSSRLLEALPPRFNTLNIEESVLSVRQKTLPPSPLPPASFAYMDIDGENDDDDDDDDDGDDEAERGNASSNSLRPAAVAYSHSASASLGSASESISSTAPEVVSNPDRVQNNTSDDEGSLDFLAQARTADPAAIRAREREYDAEMAERLAEEIPAGSSAATAGGGSGFNSPVELARRAANGAQAVDVTVDRNNGDEEDDEDGEVRSSVSS